MKILHSFLHYSPSYSSQVSDQYIDLCRNWPFFLNCSHVWINIYAWPQVSIQFIIVIQIWYHLISKHHPVEPFKLTNVEESPSFFMTSPSSGWESTLRRASTAAILASLLGCLEAGLIHCCSHSFLLCTCHSMDIEFPTALGYFLHSIFCMERVTLGIIGQLLVFANLCHASLVRLRQHWRMPPAQCSLFIRESGIALCCCPSHCSHDQKVSP